MRSLGQVKDQLCNMSSFPADFATVGPVSVCFSQILQVNFHPLVLCIFDFVAKKGKRTEWKHHPKLENPPGCVRSVLSLFL